MANSLTFHKRGFSGLFNTAALVAALCAPSFAQADILNFENRPDLSILSNKQHATMGNFWVETYDGTDFADGSVALLGTNDSCAGLACPVNNKTRYLSVLNDGYFVFGMNDNAVFRVQSLNASFIGNGQPSFPSTAGLLWLIGLDAKGDYVNDVELDLKGPVGGSFNFANYQMGAFGNTAYSMVRVQGLACADAGPCSLDSGLANFAIDDIVTVPEPTSWALMGLGLLGLAAFSRRAAR